MQVFVTIMECADVAPKWDASVKNAVKHIHTHNFKSPITKVGDRLQHGTVWGLCILTPKLSGIIEPEPRAVKSVWCTFQLSFISVSNNDLVTNSSIMITVILTSFKTLFMDNIYGMFYKSDVNLHTVQLLHHWWEILRLIKQSQVFLYCHNVTVLEDLWKKDRR